MEWRKSSYSHAHGNCVEIAMLWKKSSFSAYHGNCVEVAMSWFKSSFSNSQGACVEVDVKPEDGVFVRNSRFPDGSTLHFTDAEWDAFIAGSKAGEFDRNSVPSQ
jgi:Domain of unknown function (DUF397)